MIAAVCLFSSCSFEEYPAENRGGSFSEEYMEQLPAADANAQLQKKQLPMSKADVLKKYAKAADHVKLCDAGFTRTQHITVCDIRTHNAVFAPLWDAWISSFSVENENRSAVVRVEKGDDLACRTHFPVFNTDYGCRIPEDDCVAAAFCFDLGHCEEIVILFQEIQAKNLQADAFAQIMPAYSAASLSRCLQESFPFLKEPIGSADARYYNCELHCLLEPTTNRIISLTQKTVADATWKAAFDLLLTRTDALELTATLVCQLQYTDFIWS